LARLANQLPADNSADVALAMLRLIESNANTGTYRPGLLSRAKRRLCVMPDLAVADSATAVSKVQAQG
jgi:hypothetical protein